MVNFTKHHNCDGQTPLLYHVMIKIFGFKFLNVIKVVWGMQLSFYLQMIENWVNQLKTLCEFNFQ